MSIRYSSTAPPNTSPRTGTLSWAVWRGELQLPSPQSAPEVRPGEDGVIVQDFQHSVAEPTTVMLLAWATSRAALTEAEAAVVALQGSTVECVDSHLTLHRSVYIQTVRIVSRRRTPSGHAARSRGSRLVPTYARLEVEMTMIRQPDPSED